jgi:hypothetical protein
MDEQKTAKISIVVFIDELGWEVLKGRQFMEEQLPFRRKLRSVFGFSSAITSSLKRRERAALAPPQSHSSITSVASGYIALKKTSQARAMASQTKALVSREVPSVMKPTSACTS